MSADPKRMRALAHPIRIELLELLTIEGPLTATQCGELIGQSPSLCSFHLRQLAKYGFVEEATGAGGRDRPWQVVAETAHFGDVPDDEEGTAATAALMRAFFEREFSRAIAFAQASRNEPNAWRQASFFMSTVQWLNAEELEAISQQLEAMLTAYGDRRQNADARPVGARPVRLLASGYPMPGRMA
jgi:hypothetical protein